MTFNKARELINDIYTDVRVRQRTKFHAATWIGRIINLGYSVDQIFEIINDQGTLYSELNTMLIDRGNLLKEQYFEKLMAL
jgi:hypothetical protein